MVVCVPSRINVYRYCKVNLGTILMALVVGDEGCSVHDVIETIYQSVTYSLLVEKWKELGRRLGVEEVEIFQINERRNKDALESADLIVSVITAWKSRQASKATLQELIEQIRKMDLKDIADNLQMHHGLQSSTITKVSTRLVCQVTGKPLREIEGDDLIVINGIIKASTEKMKPPSSKASSFDGGRYFKFMKSTCSQKLKSTRKRATELMNSAKESFRENQ